MTVDGKTLSCVRRRPYYAGKNPKVLLYTRRVDGTYVKRTRSVEGPTFNEANKILEIIVTPEPTPNPPLNIMKSPEHLGFGSNYRSLYFIFGLKVRPKTLTSHALEKSPNLAELSQRVGS